MGERRLVPMKKIISIISCTLSLVLLIAAPVLAIFPLFLFIWSIHSKIQLRLNNFYKKYIALGLLFGLCTELLAVYDNRDIPPEEKILFHPHPAIDLLLGVGFYFFIAVMWAVVVKKYAFTVKSIFVIGGIWGIVAEQNLAILLSPLSLGIVLGLFSYGFVFLVYGPFMAIPALFFKEAFDTEERKERKFRHAVLAFLLLCGAYMLAGMYMILLYAVLGLS
jgi:hypothetical protein